MKAKVSVKIFDYFTLLEVRQKGGRNSLRERLMGMTQLVFLCMKCSQSQCGAAKGKPLGRGDGQQVGGEW